jgi:hypothetical protein
MYHSSAKEDTVPLFYFMILIGMHGLTNGLPTSLRRSWRGSRRRCRGEGGDLRRRRRVELQAAAMAARGLGLGLGIGLRAACLGFKWSGAVLWAYSL